VAGKLYGQPEQRMSAKTGKSYVIARLRAAAGDGDALFVSCVAFDVAAQAVLLAMEDGDAVTLAGSLTPKAWIGKAGEPRVALDMVVQRALTAYHLTRKRAAVAAAGEAEQPKPPQRPRPSPLAEFFPEDNAWLQGAAV
jgi:single-stranded DNA-binding protein